MRNPSASGDQVADLLAEAVQDARPGLADGGGRHVQVLGDDGGRLAIDGGAPEGLPGSLLERVTRFSRPDRGPKSRPLTGSAALPPDPPSQHATPATRWTGPQPRRPRH